MGRVDGKITLTDLVEKKELERIQEAFHKATGILAEILDAKGDIVTDYDSSISFCDNCVKKTRIGKEKCKNCKQIAMDYVIEKREVVMYECHAGLTLFAAPILVNDKIIGYIWGGKIFSKKVTFDDMAILANKLKGNPDEFIVSQYNVLCIDTEKVKHSAELFSTISNMLSDSAYNKIKTEQLSNEIEKSANMKSDFLANMSHEIRTPMNAVIGMAQMALREDLPAVAKDYINQIMNSGKSLLAIINDILDFSKIESGKLDIVEMDYSPVSLINEIASMMMTRLGSKNLELIFDIDKNIPKVLHGDNVRVKQIIVNLCNNAIKFTKEGYVSLSLTAEKKDDKSIILKGIIKDTGIGIKEQDLGKLFNSFSQVDSKRNRNIEGTGLGLAICRQLLSLMDGSISVESEYGKGSTFFFEVPQRIVEKEPIGGSVNMGEKTVAFFVENEIVRNQLIKDLKELSVEYDEVKKEAEIEFIDKNKVGFFFIDEYSFTDFVKEFAQKNANIKFVVLTTFSSSFESKIANVISVKRPVHAINLVSLLSGMELIVNTSVEDGFDDMDFIAPNAKVLIVDDNEINLTVAVGLLKPLQMQVDTATGGKEAIDMVSRKKYDIVFMDHMMPEIDGVEATRIIRRFNPDYKKVPIVALTANAVEGTKNMLLSEGMDDFVSKPIEIKAICAVVKRWLRDDLIKKSDTKSIAMMSKIGKTSSDVVDQNALGLLRECLDVDSAITLLGTQSLYMAVLRDYFRAIDKKSKKILELYEREDWKDYTIEVHALKSASRQIGALELSELAAELEKAGIEKNYKPIKANTKVLLDMYKGLEVILEPLFVNTQSVNPQEKKNPILAADLAEFFRELRVAMDELDIDEMEGIVARMDEFSYDRESIDFFEELVEMIDSMDVEACEDVITRWEKVVLP